MLSYQVEALKIIDIESILGSKTTFKKSGQTLKALCCFHQEKTASLTIFPKTNTFHCFGCNASGDSIEAFKLINNLSSFQETIKMMAEFYGITDNLIETITPVKRSEKKKERNPVFVPKDAVLTIYKYSQNQIVKRWDWEESGSKKKTMRPFIKKGSQWEMSGEGLWPVYGLPSESSWTIGVEGEKCVDVLLELGLPSLTFQGGSWDEESVKAALSPHPYLRVIYISDNDKPGLHKFEKLGKICGEMNIPFKHLPIKELWRECPDGGDIADYLDHHSIKAEDLINNIEVILFPKKEKKEEEPQSDESTASKLLTAIEEAENIDDPVLRALKIRKIRQKFEFRSESEMFRLLMEIKAHQPVKRLTAKEFCSLKLVESQWVVEGLFKQGSLAIIAAPPKAGKSLWHYDLAYAIAKGKEWGEFPCTKSNVLLIQTDEPLVECQERLKTRGLDKLNNYHVITTWNINQVKKLEEHIKELDAKFVIIDSLSSSLGSASISINDPQIGFYVNRIKQVAEQTGCCILLVHHCNKMNENEELNKVAGSTFIVSAASDILLLSEPLNKSPDRLERILSVAGSRTIGKGTAWKLKLNTEDNSYDFLGPCSIDGSEHNSSVIPLEEKLDLKRQIKAFLGNNKGWFSLEEICAELRLLNNSHLRKIMSELFSLGIVTREKKKIMRGDGTYTTAYHYCLPEDTELTTNKPVITPSDNRTELTTDKPDKPVITPSDKLTDLTTDKPDKLTDIKGNLVKVGDEVELIDDSLVHPKKGEIIGIQVIKSKAPQGKGKRYADAVFHKLEVKIDGHVELIDPLFVKVFRDEKQERIG